MTFYADLPENDADADNAFDAVTAAISERLNEREIPYVMAGSFDVEDADTEPEDGEDNG